MNSSEKTRGEILKIYAECASASTKVIAKKVGCCERTVRRAINKFKAEGTIKDKARSGRPKGSGVKKVEREVLKVIQKNRCASVRDIAKAVYVSATSVHKIKKRLKISTFKKQKAPKRSANQVERAKTRARSFYRNELRGQNVCLVLDDESYLKFDFNTLPGHQFYNVLPGETVPEEESHVHFEKFGPKALVWQAICECGMKSTPFFTTGTIDSETYMKECLQKRLLPFLRKHDKPTLFWPDLAPAHYSRATLQWYESHNINFVKKDMNPPNVPELRPIERYWAIMKAKLKKTRATVKNTEELKKHWLAVSRNFDEGHVKNLMKDIRKKIRNCAHHDNYVLKLYKIKIS